MSKTLVSILLLTFFTAESKDVHTDTIKPLTVNCTVFVQNLEGHPDLHSQPSISVTLKAKNEPTTDQLVNKVGDFEFWIATHNALSNKTESELETYTAQIRNDKLKLKVSAESSKEIMIPPNSSSKVIKSAKIELEHDGAKLSLSCHHFPSANKDQQLKLTH